MHYLCMIQEHDSVPADHHHECCDLDTHHTEVHYLLQAREKLMEENSKLRSRLDVANEQIVTLKSHIGVIRQNTIAFILEQMDALHMQRDTEV